MNRFKDHNGIQMLPVRSLKLVVPVELAPEAHRIVKSEYGPNTAHLGLSEAGPSILAARGISVEVVEDPNVPSSRQNQWALVANDRVAGRHLMAVAWGPELASETQVRKGTYTVDADSYFGPVFNGWQHAFGSLGTGATI